MNDDIRNILEKIEKAEGVFRSNEAAVQYNDEPLKTKYASIPRSTGKLLHSMVLAKRPSTILELGSSIGYSTIWLASAAKINGGKVITTEKSRNRVALAKKHFESSGLDNIEIIHGDILEILAAFNEAVDFVFVDADKNEYQQYLSVINPLLKPSSIIIFDNVLSHYDKVKSFINHTINNPTFHSELLPFDNGLLVLYKK